jgi:P-type Cu+ transporter
MSFGTSIAYFASIAELIIATTRSSKAAHSMTSTQSYFDSVVFLTMFLLVSLLIEARMKVKARDAVAALSKLRSTEALLVLKDIATGNTTTSKVPVDLIETGDVVRIPNGASLPSDGFILEGDSKFDESSLTRESKPVSKSVGDSLLRYCTSGLTGVYSGHSSSRKVDTGLHHIRGSRGPSQTCSCRTGLQTWSNVTSFPPSFSS